MEGFFIPIQRHDALRRTFSLIDHEEVAFFFFPCDALCVGIFGRQGRPYGGRNLSIGDVLRKEAGCRKAKCGRYGN